jgi:hypothetical protein
MKISPWLTTGFGRFFKPHARYICQVCSSGETL